MNQAVTAPSNENISWVASLPFFAAHLMCLFAFQVGISKTLVALALASYYGRMLLVTIVYHRYFSHRSFKTSRWFQFILAALATTTVQKGVLWWAAHHRHHHRESDQPGDIHSPALGGFWWSHVGWILSRKYDETRFESIRDFAAYPELRWLNRYYLVPPVLYATGLFLLGGFPWLIWGFFISTVLLWHGTFTINSLSHVFGRRRYRTTDTSRNNWLLALVTCGEGWHNNHHYYQNTANQGWFWWEIDLSYYVLRLLNALGLVWELRTPRPSVKYAHLQYTAEERAELDREVGVFGLGVSGFARAKLAKAKVQEAWATVSEALPAAPPSPAVQRTR